MANRTVFISYNHADRPAALRIEAAVAEAGWKPWIDHRAVQPGESFVERMQEGLTDAGYVLLLMTHNSLASSWVRREWMSTLAKQGTVLLPLKLEEDGVPRLLADIINIDFTKSFDAGLEQLKAFFRREDEKAVPEGSSSTQRPAAGVLATATTRELRLVVQRCVDNKAFRDLLWDLNIKEGALRGECLEEKLVDLLHHADREDVLGKLREYVEQDHRACVAKSLERLRHSA